MYATWALEGCARPCLRVPPSRKQKSVRTAQPHTASDSEPFRDAGFLDAQLHYFHPLGRGLGVC